MYLYTHYEVGGIVRHLKITVPADWTEDDLQFFMGGRPHLQIGESQIAADSESCPDHPYYTGQRLGKIAKTCEKCIAIWNRVHSQT